jgi:hypothetical protein
MNTTIESFNTEEEVINDYLSNYVGVKAEELETYYNSNNGKEKFCIRIKGTKMLESFKTYTVTKSGKFKY